MLVANGQDGGNELILLGITDENVKRLIEGKPIRCKASTHPGIPKGLTLLIVYGETEQAIYDELKGTGAMDGCIVRKDERL